MQKHEFDTMAGLDEVANGLARASRHPVHVDLGTDYGEAGAIPLNQQTLDQRRSLEQVADNVEPQDDLYAIWNSREDERAYIGSKRYRLIQHREVLDVIAEAVSNTRGSIDKGVVRDYGDHVRGVLVFGNTDEAVIDVHELVGDGYVPPEGAGYARDRLGLGMRFENSFNGRSGFGGSTMGYRYICQNWMVWGEEQIADRSDYHIRGSDDDHGVPPEYYEELIHSVFERRDMLEGVVKESVEEGEIPLEWAPQLLADAGFGKNYQRRITGRLLSQDKERDGYVNVWDVYNAATYHLDHDMVQGLGPETYDRHQADAWDVLQVDPRPPEEDVDVEEFARVPV